MDREADLCPECGMRDAGPSGSCRPCELRRLAGLHREALAEIAAQRELWTAKQQVHRDRGAALREGVVLTGIAAVGHRG